jgi:hypothetical protein
MNAACGNSLPVHSLVSVASSSSSVASTGVSCVVCIYIVLSFHAMTQQCLIRKRFVSPYCAMRSNAMASNSVCVRARVADITVLSHSHH